MENFFVLGQKSRNGYKPIRPYAHVKSCKYTKNETWERHDVLRGKDKSMELEMLAMLTEFSFENPAGTGTEYCIMFKAPSDGNLAIINKQGVNLLIFIPFERNAKNSLLSVDFSFNESSKKKYSHWQCYYNWKV